jgi:uncharacterized membrane protein
MEVSARVGRSRLLMTLALAMAVAGCAAMLVLRAGLTGRIGLRLLVWNMFLAVVPYPFALLVDVLGRRPHVRSWVLLAPGAVWLAFFPNAPYLVTDLIHLQPTRAIPLWYDGLVFFAFAATGLLLAFASLYLVQATVARRRSPTWGWAVAAASIGLGSYGIYLGRIQRWNSWDVLTHPSQLFHSVSAQIIDPVSNRTAVVLTVGFAVFLTAVYAILLAFANLVGVDAPQR